MRTTGAFVGDWPGERATVRPIPLPDVKVGGFLGRRMEVNRPSLLAGLESPIPKAFEALARGERPGQDTM